MEDFSEQNKYESEFCLHPSFDFPFSSQTNKRFIVLSTPRSGSTMLTSALFETSSAGAPFEYLHESSLKYAGNPERHPGGLKKYFEDLEAKRTSPNGVFGIKLAFDQYNELFGRNPISAEYGFNFLRGFDKFILIHRRDKIMQSISSVIAKHNQIWALTNTADRPALDYNLDAVDIETISKAITGHLVADNSWRQVLAYLRKDYLEIAYEDLHENLGNEMRRFFDYVGIEADLPENIEAPTIKTTNSESTSKIKNRYLKIIGAFESDNKT